nr:MAG TPA: hypothetical protein [Caudoviricetes sp.]
MEDIIFAFHHAFPGVPFPTKIKYRLFPSVCFTVPPPGIG